MNIPADFKELLTMPVRTVTDNFQAALDLAFRLDGQRREIWINDGKSFLKPITIDSLWYRDTTGPKQLIGSDVIFSCDATLIVRTRDLPREPLVGELLFYPRNQSWQIADVMEAQGILQIGLNRARAPSQ
jgi:hypothetical protein